MNNLLKDIKKSYLIDLIAYYPEREAEQLLLILIDHLFGISRYDVMIRPDTRLSESEILKLHMAVKDLKKYKPVQYITGEVEFQDMRILVNKDVLIPRQETEELVHLIYTSENEPGLNVLDIGTGSGCISISLDKKLIEPLVYATDISPSAIETAKENASLNNSNVSFFIHDIFDDSGFFDDNIKFDIIVSNPPYVTQDDKSKMQPNVVDYEPHIALFVPQGNPLIFYDAILRFAIDNLIRGGRLYTEINESLGSEMVELFEKYNYSNISLVKDINGKVRFVHAIKD